MLTCNTSTSLNQATVATYRFRTNRTKSNATQVSCYFKFEVTDKSEKILLQVFPNCSSSDELGVSNGNNSSNLSCNQPPSVYVNWVTVTYISNYTEPGEFGIDIKIVTGKDFSNCSSSVTRITVETSPVIITSPNFPDIYPINAQCSYDISSADPNKGLSLILEVINLEGGCHDSITLALNNSEPIRICDLPSNDLFLYYKNYTSEGSVRLNFYSDYSVQAHGFRLKISQVQVLTCNTSIALNQASVATYGFGINNTNPNASQVSCYFIFEVTDVSEKILLQLFPKCSANDELNVNNGNNLCCSGCDQPPSVHVNSVIVIFKGGNNTEPGKLGFEIIIITGSDSSHCSSSVNQITVGISPVTITSPNFPEKYPSSRQCSYMISADDPNKGLSLILEVINLENKCYDSITLELYNSQPIQICNLTSTDLVLLNENYISQGEVYLRFNSDISIQAHGFRLRISQVNTLEASTTSSTAITPATKIEAYTTLSTLTTTNMKTTVETAPTTQDISSEKTTVPSRTAKDEPTSGTSTTTIFMAVVIGIVSVSLISVLIYIKCYRNRSTKEPMFERPFHNPAYNDYEIPVKTHADEGDGYEELPMDIKDGNAYNIYLSIKE